ncbi:hypothetical protein GCM10027449_18870 [Sinomonas notoginsengisoli]
MLVGVGGEGGQECLGFRDRQQEVDQFVHRAVRGPGGDEGAPSDARTAGSACRDEWKVPGS